MTAQNNLLPEHSLGLATFDPLEKYHQQLDAIESDCEASLADTNPMQGHFARLIVEGDDEGKRMTQTAAAIAAGYSPKTAEKQASALMRNPKVKKAILMLRRRASYVSAISVGWKRRKLVEIVEVASDPDGPGYNPNAAVAGVKVLSQIDNDIAYANSKNAGNVTINISTGVKRNVTQEGVTINQESDTLELEVDS